MNSVKLFKKVSLDFTADSYKSSIKGLINVGNSASLGAGVGVLYSGCNMLWRVTYDEVIFVHEGDFEIIVNDKSYPAESGDVLWIPANTELTYMANEDVMFFYAVYPADKSPSTNVAINYPETSPEIIEIV
ncbi:cupin domain-containing protein [Dasania marina]|uniref:cupin domain-containing protein n=1 Tax=Dasania marina TaxID=471499 RepID=UPI0030DB11DA|tara:strand:- start:72786 stop:73178 length:393 start_codon:yes stop_codon:yes gene_type:complete